MDLFIILTLEELVCVFKAKCQKWDYLLYGHISPLGEYSILLKFAFYYVNGGVCGNWGEECLDIIRCHDLYWLQLDLCDVLHKTLGIFEVMQGLANQGIDDVGQFLDDPISDGSPTRDNGDEGCQIYVFWVNHRNWGQLHWWDIVFCICYH